MLPISGISLVPDVIIERSVELSVSRIHQIAAGLGYDDWEDVTIRS